jgi:hypothetical protein
MNIQDCIDDLLIKGTEDWIDACEVASVAKTVGGATSASAVRDLSLRAVAELINRGLMEPGDVDRSGFRSWGIPAAQAIARIQREWRALGRNPNLGEVCWLANTNEGDALGTRLAARGGG